MYRPGRFSPLPFFFPHLSVPSGQSSSTCPKCSVPPTSVFSHSLGVAVVGYRAGTSWSFFKAQLSLDSSKTLGVRLVLVLSRFGCLTLCNPVDCSLQGSSVHGISQARIPEWVAISFSRGSFQPRDGTHVSYISCIGSWVLYH